MNDGWHILRKDPTDLPKERDWYLVVLKEKETGFVLVPKIGDYIGDVTAITNCDGWCIANCTDTGGYDYDYYKERCKVIAWREIPEMPKELRGDF